MQTPAARHNEVLRQICKHYEVTVSLALSPARSRSCFLARRDFAIYLRTQGWSYPRIAKRLNRDHTTILNCVGRLKKRGKWPQPDHFIPLPSAMAVQGAPMWSRGYVTAQRLASYHRRIEESAAA